VDGAFASRSPSGSSDRAVVARCLREHERDRATGGSAALCGPMKRIVEAVRGRLVPAGKCEGAGSSKQLAPRRLTPACYGISSLVAGAVTDVSGAATVAAPAASKINSAIWSGWVISER